MNHIPWIFGDEYLYLSKARNIARGIDVLADVSQGHAYPPLYSYLISLVMGSDPLISYQSVQWLNFIVSQLLIFLSFYLLNRVFGWTKSRLGWLFLGLAYLLISFNTTITGFYSVAMSENLYTPLVILSFSLFVFIDHRLQKTDKNQLIFVVALALIASLAYLTRTIGLAVVVASAVGIFVSLLKHKKQLKQALLIGVLLLIAGTVFIWLFNFWESSQLVRQGLKQPAYEDLQSNYFAVIRDLLSLTANWFWTVKIIGNHFVYLMLGSFFLPFYFLLKELLTFIKTRKIKASTIFFITYALVVGSLSFLHCYSGFKGGQAIKYSTYFRYLDQVLVLLNLYGLISLWEMITKKQKIDKKVAWLYAIVALVALLFLPNRDFYTTLNSFAWGWLDIFLQPVWLGRVIGGLLLLLSIFILWKKQFYYLFIITALLLQIFTLPKIMAMHNWLASDFQALIKPIRTLALDHHIQHFYISDDYLEKDLLGSLYFTKYLLLFYGDQFEPVQVIEAGQLASLETDFAYLSNPQVIEELDNIFTNRLSISEQLMIGIKQDGGQK